MQEKNPEKHIINKQVLIGPSGSKRPFYQAHKGAIIIFMIKFLLKNLVAVPYTKLLNFYVHLRHRVN